MRTRLALSLSVLLALDACAYQRPRSFLESFAAAERAQRLGRASEAARMFDEAARTTARPLDRDEAIYRAGQAYRRAGDVATALARFEWLATRGDDSARRTRGELECVRIYFDRGQWDRAEQVAVEVAARQPAMGAGRRAIELALIEADARDPSGVAGDHFAERAWARLQRTELAATLDVERARRAVRAGRTNEAVAFYERALTWRYPQNPRWDDASFELARLHLDAGRAPQALAVIDRALSMREQLVLIPGSAVRPKFPQLAFERGRVLEAMGERARAAAAYHDVYTGYPVSTLRDDALEAESRVRTELRDRDGACAVDARLAREFACTRRGRRALERALACGAITARDNVRCTEPHARAARPERDAEPLENSESDAQDTSENTGDTDATPASSPSPSSPP